MTARWAVDVIEAERDLNITWQPISLLVKNEPSPDSDYYPPVVFSHGLLRVMEAARAAAGEDAVAGNQAVKDLYWNFASRIHHDREYPFDVAEAVAEAGHDPALAAAAEDESYDAEIDTRMTAGLNLVGNDVGTPLIAWDRADGDRIGIFGPVITRVPDTDASLRLWDAMVTMTEIDGFWELKRTRTESPEFGDRP